MRYRFCDLMSHELRYFSQPYKTGACSSVKDENGTFPLSYSQSKVCVKLVITLRQHEKGFEMRISFDANPQSFDKTSPCVI